MKTLNELSSEQQKVYQLFVAVYEKLKAYSKNHNKQAAEVSSNVTLEELSFSPLNAGPLLDEDISSSSAPESLLFGCATKNDYGYQTILDKINNVDEDEEIVLGMTFVRTYKSEKGTTFTDTFSFNYILDSFVENPEEFLTRLNTDLALLNTEQAASALRIFGQEDLINQKDSFQVKLSFGVQCMVDANDPLELQYYAKGPEETTEFFAFKRLVEYLDKETGMINFKMLSDEIFQQVFAGVPAIESCISAYKADLKPMFLGFFFFKLDENGELSMKVNTDGVFDSSVTVAKDTYKKSFTDEPEQFFVMDTSIPSANNSNNQGSSAVVVSGPNPYMDPAVKPHPSFGRMFSVPLDEEEVSTAFKPASST